ncbi:MAG: flagellar export chaperone FliS [Phycisphaerae bacterium]|nr:flagellar export chaperone FliS [Phycisphaerae bacterium]
MDNQTSTTSNQYLKTKVMTASPEELQMMLYDGAIRFAQQARQSIVDKEIENSYKLLTKTQKIVLELSNSMRDEISPETCAQMRALYLYCYERLVTANMSRDIEPLDEAIKILIHIRETWCMLMDKLKEERGQEQENLAMSQFNSELAAMGVGSSFSCDG